MAGISGELAPDLTGAQNKNTCIYRCFWCIGLRSAPLTLRPLRGAAGAFEAGLFALFFAVVAGKQSVLF